MQGPGDEELLQYTSFSLHLTFLVDEQLLQDTFADLATNITAQNASIYATNAKVRPALCLSHASGCAGWQRKPGRLRGWSVDVETSSLGKWVRTKGQRRGSGAA